jgi:anti-anti-sigma factor
MQLSSERRGDVWVVRVGESKLTYPVLSAFSEEVRRMVDDGARQLVIDLGSVSYIDSASIGCLMEIHRLLEAHAGEVRLAGPQPRVATLLTMTLAHKVMGIHSGTAEAIAAFDGAPAAG